VTRAAARPARLQPELFAYSFPVRVYFENTDAGGVVYHAEYLKFLERARTEWLRHLGYGHQALARNHRVVFVVTQAVADFLKPARLDDILLACECDARGRLGFEDAPYPQRARLNAALAAVQSVATSVIAARAASMGVTGQKVGEMIHAARVQAVADWLATLAD